MAITKKKTSANKLFLLASLACNKDDVDSQSSSSSSSSSSSTTLHDAPKLQQQPSSKQQPDKRGMSSRDQPKQIHAVPVHVLAHRRRRLIRRQRQRPFKKRSLRVAVPMNIDVDMHVDDNDVDVDDNDDDGCDYQVHTIDLREKKKSEAIVSNTTSCRSAAISSVITQTRRTTDAFNKENKNTNKKVIVEDRELKEKVNLVQRQQLQSPAPSKEIDSMMQEQIWKHLHKPLSLPSYLPNPTMALYQVRSISLKIQECY